MASQAQSIAPAIYPLLLIGEANDGPVGNIYRINLSDDTDVATALQYYGEDKAESITLSISATGTILNSTPWNTVYFANPTPAGYNLLSLPQCQISGNVLTHATPA